MCLQFELARASEEARYQLRGPEGGSRPQCGSWSIALKVVCGFPSAAAAVTWLLGAYVEKKGYKSMQSYVVGPASLFLKPHLTLVRAPQPRNDQWRNPYERLFRV